MVNQEDAIFNNLRGVIGAPSPPSTQSDDDLVARFRDFHLLRPNQKLQLATLALQNYNASLQRNRKAMAAERQRLQEQIDVIDREMGIGTPQRLMNYHCQGADEQMEELVRMVLQRRRLDGDSEGMEEKVGRRWSA